MAAVPERATSSPGLAERLDRVERALTLAAQRLAANRWPAAAAGSFFLERGSQPLAALLSTIEGGHFLLLSLPGASMSLGLDPEGAPRLRIVDERLSTRLEVAVGGDQSSSITLHDREGAPRLHLEVDPAGAPACRARGPHGDERLCLRVTRAGAARVAPEPEGRSDGR